MQKISELRHENLIYNHIIYDNEYDRHLAKHCHSLVELIYILHGEVSYTIEDKQFIARAGDLILVKPYAYHFFTITNKQDYEKIGVLFSESEIDVKNITSENFLLLPCESGRIYDIMKKIDFYFHNCPTKTFSSLTIALTKEILINIELFHTEQLVTKHNLKHPLIERALNYINSNLFNFDTIKKLADSLSVSEGYLKMLFTEQLKIPPKKYITQKRLLMARSMITNGTPPTQTAYLCGYSHYATFYRGYMKLFNVNPMIDFQNSKKND